MNTIKKGLGRGLSSLIGETKVESKANKLSLSEIMPNRYQPRKNFDEEMLKDLSNSIKERGVIQPIIVRKSNSENSKYEISIDQIIYFIKREPTSRVGGGASSLSEIQKGEILELMESIIPDDFLMLIEIVYLLYYSKSEIHEKIGWNTDELAEENKMEAFDDSILNNIKKREPFWRKA